MRRPVSPPPGQLSLQFQSTYTALDVAALGEEALLYTQFISRAIAAVTICTLLAVGLPTSAQTNTQAVSTLQDNPGHATANTLINNKPVLLAQAAACSTCGAELNPLLLLATGKERKDRSPLTDSLWGNLILELAYQRDPELQKIGKKLNLVSLGTLGAIGGIAGGTLAQGISAIYVINPSPGRQDSYAPLILGTALSSATLAVFAARILLNHKLAKQTSNRQFALKAQVESILAHMESSGAKCDAAKKELTGLIGERACREWIDLYQSSHQLAMTSPRRFTLLNIPGHTD